MNVDRLNAILSALFEDHQHLAFANKIANLIKQVNQKMSNPSDQEADSNISRVYLNIVNAADESTTNKFTPTWLKLIHEINVEVLLASEIKSRIEGIFSDYKFNTELVDRLSSLQSEINNKLSSISDIKKGFDAIGLEGEELSFGQVELGVLIPRESINDNLPGLKKELDKLYKDIVVISNVCKSKDSDFKVKNLSTSDFSVILNINVDLGEVLIFIFGVIMLSNIEMKKKTDAIKDTLSDLPEDLLDSFREWAKNHINSRVEEIYRELEKKFKHSIDVKSLRQHEESVKKAIGRIAEMFERGFNLDVRVGADPSEIEEEGEGAEGAIDDNRERLKQLSEKASQLKVIERQRMQILSLSGPEHGEAEEESADDESVSNGQTPASDAEESDKQ